MKSFFLASAIAVIFLAGVPAAFAQGLTSEAALAQIGNLLALVRDLQKQLEELQAAQAASMTPPKPPAAASTPVRVLSPDMGEGFVQGQSIPIAWSGGGEKVQVGIIDETFETSRSILGWVSLSEQPNGSLAWDGRTVFDISGTVRRAIDSLSHGPYKVIAVSSGTNRTYCVLDWSGCNYDVSSAYFSVLIPLVPPVGALNASCSSSASTVQTNTSVTWQATSTNGTPPYMFSWSGTDGISLLPARGREGQFLEVVYFGAGTKTAAVTVRDKAGKEYTTLCNAPLVVTASPPPITLLVPAGGEQFVMTNDLDPSQFIRVLWRMERLSAPADRKLEVGLRDIFGRVCTLAKVPRSVSEVFVGVINGLRCPEGWTLGPGLYKARVALEGFEATVSSESENYVTLTAPVPDVQSITPSLSVANSGESVKFRLTAPPHALRATLSFFCPQMVTSSVANICNRSVDVSAVAARSSDYSASFTNNSSQPQKVAANFYVYLPNNPNYGRGMHAEVTISASTTAANAEISVLLPNGGESIVYGVPYTYRFAGSIGGTVNLSLVPDPPVDAGLVCQIGTDIPASLRQFSFTLPANGACAKGPAKTVLGSYKLLAVLKNGDVRLRSDASNASFSVVSTTTPAR